MKEVGLAKRNKVGWGEEEKNMEAVEKGDLGMSMEVGRARGSFKQKASSWALLEERVDVVWMPLSCDTS